jgi:hypothetical protein
MIGLDVEVVEALDYELAIGRVRTDVLTDFILAPQYSVVYAHASDELVERLKIILRTGQYAPELPLRVDVPKKSGLTRPGAILTPLDRLLYQTLVDDVSLQAEAQLDRERVFSHVLLDADTEFRMFKPMDECWQNMQNALLDKYTPVDAAFVVRTDVSCYFERIYQHNLINLLHSSNCRTKVVNLLEKVLSAFTEKDSHGILQGMFPSDFLGNFYLAIIDDHFKSKNIPSIRYVDDIYAFYSSINEAKKGLMDLCRILRDEGLNLNESKTDIFQIEDLISEETEVDRLFRDAKDEIKNAIEGELLEAEYYGFQSIWDADSEDEEQAEQEIEFRAVEKLYMSISEHTTDSEKIEKFCLPYLAKSQNEIAIRSCIDGIVKRPHLSKIYCSYLKPFAHNNAGIAKQLESLVNADKLPYDWSLLWLFAALIDIDKVAESTVVNAMRILEDSRRFDGLRSIAALLVARHGTAGQRRLIKHHYAEEPSPYVKQAILFACKYLPANERNSCLGAWGNHSTTNSLIASAIRAGRT